MAVIPDMDFENKDMIDWTIRDSNVVINLVGPRADLKKRRDFEFINVEVPRRIAQACNKNENIIRFIHFSSAGASPSA